MTKTKSWYLSKTLWVGVLQVLASIITFLVDFLQSGDYSEVAVATFISGVIMIVLRFITSQPIA